MYDPQHLETIRNYAGDIRDFDNRIKTANEQRQEIVEKLPEYDEVVEAKAKLKAANDNLKRRLASNREYCDISEKIEEDKESRASARQTLSDYLVAYFKDTGERQIELSEGDGRQVVVNAKLGKQKNFQTSMFSGQKP